MTLRFLIIHLSHGADQNTPLHIAILNKHSDVAIQLIKAGAKVCIALLLAH